MTCVTSETGTAYLAGTPNVIPTFSLIWLLQH